MTAKALSRVESLMYWFAGHWLTVVLALVFLYVALPIAAPTLMHLGIEGPARVIYTLYKPLCHQLGFRSFFLFGAQPAYPLDQVPGQSLTSFQAYAIDEPAFRDLFAHYQTQYTGEAWSAEQVALADLAPFSAGLQMAAREFVGSPEMGYKVALCERDIAIYGAIVLGGLLFIPARRKLRPVPLLLYLVLGIGPIALDGGSQLLGTAGFWPERETYPIFRVITGALFGIMNVWLAFPYIEMSMREMRAALGERRALAADDEARKAEARARLQEYVEAWQAQDQDDQDEDSPSR